MPKVLKILKAPNEILTTPTKPVEKFDKKLRKLIANMIVTLKAQTDPPGIGLAANQVGQPFSLFIMWVDTKKQPIVFINPKILKKESFQKKLGKKQELEGCLSIPKIWGSVKRYRKVLVEFYDEKGKKHERWFSGLEAIVVQHEIDHLKGVLFTKQALSQGSTLFKEEGEELKPIKLL